LEYSFIPRKCSFKSQINDLTSSDPDTKDIFTNAEWDIQLLHEVRFYLGKDMEKFYIAFYRHCNTILQGELLTTDLGGQADIDIGKLSANTFGLQFGSTIHLKNLF
jgi:hypothetical protein